jgi:isopenicillin-N N-acyltransferase like protein
MARGCCTNQTSKVMVWNEIQLQTENLFKIYQHPCREMVCGLCQAQKGVFLVMIVAVTSLFFSLILSANHFANAAYCNGSPDPGERTNENPIFDGDSTMTFIRSVKNGAVYEAGPANARFPVVHVSGNAYEVGYAQGLVQKEYLREFIAKTYTYFLGLAVDEMGDKISPFWQGVIVFKGLNRALDWCAEITAPYTPQEFYDELHGLADASGVDYQTLLRLNMFPEITKASCSFFGAYGNATLESGNTYQLRALDYDTVGPFKDYPQLTIYHPTDGQPFANLGWPGSIGVLSGFSSSQMALSEIGVTYPDDSFEQGTKDTAPQKVKGEPWMFILRDVLKYETSLSDAITRIQNSDRTCNLIIGVGDGEISSVNGIQYSGYVANPYDDQTLLPENATWHPIIDGVVYNGMDWLW